MKTKERIKARYPMLYAALRGRFLAARSLCVALRRGRYINRTWHYRAGTPALYLSNSKVACSSIKASMHGLNEETDYQKVHSAVYKLSQIAKNIETNAYPGWYRFTFVRDPFERLVSCYESKYHADKKLLGQSMTRLHFDDYLLGYLRKDRGFAHFALRVCRIPDWLSDRHFVSQAHLTQGANLDFVGRFEQLQADYEPIRARFGFAPLKHYNRVDKGNWMDAYDLKTARLVYARYKADVEKFGYEDSYRRLTEYLTQKEGESK